MQSHCALFPGTCLLHSRFTVVTGTDTEGRVSRALGRPLTWLRITPLREGTGLDDVTFPSALTFYGEFRALVKSNFNKRIIWKILCGTSIKKQALLFIVNYKKVDANNTVTGDKKQ